MSRVLKGGHQGSGPATLADFDGVEWELGMLGPSLGDPAVLQRIERAVLLQGSQVQYFDQQELSWYGLKQVRAVFRARITDQHGRPYAEFSQLKQANARACGAIKQGRKAKEAIYNAIGGGAAAAPRPGGDRRARAFARSLLPAPATLLEGEMIIDEASKALKRAWLACLKQGRILVFRRTGLNWDMLSPSRAVAIMNVTRVPRDLELSFLISGELPAALQKPGKGGPKGTLVSRVVKYMREKIEADPAEMPWRTKAEAFAALREEFPDLSQTMFEDKIWPKAASEKMKGPGVRLKKQ